jgi:hypothetical protein
MRSYSGSSGGPCYEILFLSSANKNLARILGTLPFIAMAVKRSAMNKQLNVISQSFQLSGKNLHLK